MELELEHIIHTAIVTHIKVYHIEVTGDGHHFDALVISDEFNGKSLVARHRLIYQALGDRMKEQVHALSMKLYTTTEWGNANAKINH